MRPDVIFIPSARWLTTGLTTVVMVRNMEPLATPVDGNPPSEILRNLLRRRVARIACRRATRILAVSGFVGDFLRNTWVDEPNKIGVVYHGVRQPVDQVAKKAPAPLREHGISRFLFTAGSIRPARGLEDVVRALGFLRRSGEPLPPLVIAGAPSRSTLSYKEKVSRLAEEAGVFSSIHWVGHIDEAEMSWCFDNCAAVVLTSRVEACPNVALEAMAHGCVCISADIPPLVEVLGRSGLFYQSGNAASLAKILHSMTGSAPAEFRRVRELARDRSKQFSWNRTAEATLHQLQLALSDRGPESRGK